MTSESGGHETSRQFSQTHRLVFADSTFVPLSQARGLRDHLLYQADNSVVNTSLLVKCEE